MLAMHWFDASVEWLIHATGTIVVFALFGVIIFGTWGIVLFIGKTLWSVFTSDRDSLGE